MVRGCVIRCGRVELQPVTCRAPIGRDGCTLLCCLFFAVFGFCVVGGHKYKNINRCVMHLLTPQFSSQKNVLFL